MSTVSATSSATPVSAPADEFSEKTAQVFKILAERYPSLKKGSKAYEEAAALVYDQISFFSSDTDIKENEFFTRTEKVKEEYKKRFPSKPTPQKEDLEKIYNELYPLSK